MKTFVKITVNLLLLLMMLATLLGGAYWYSWQQNVPVSAIQVKFSKDQTKIGEPVTAEILVQTPWYRNVEESLIFSSATDDVKFLEGQIDIQLKSIGIHGRVWQIKTQLLAFAAGSYKDLKVDIPLSPDRDIKQNKLVVTLPELTVAANELKGDITFMADIDPQELIEEKISEVQPRPWWHTALYVVATIVIVILIIVIDRKIRHSRKLNYWQQAKKNLDELE
ncbi:MAG: hypothetical protein HRT88_00610, partial [Lentisphaeraceae bacterium]|nr:hypothetical protein [Lentisphaeraceae bacterium]